MDKNIEDMLERAWYFPFCTKEEIDRIISPQTAKDYLLQERANVVADNMRYLRVYRNKAQMFKNWSFETSFTNTHYEMVVNRLSDEDNSFCKNIVYGDMFSNDVNGYAIKNPTWGRIICLNESLQFFMKFCNLAMFDFKCDVPWKIRTNSLRIAIRVMLKQEAMDFFMDPRGTVPEEVGVAIHKPIKYELQYIAGHEFSHHLCGHFKDNDISERNILSMGQNNYFKPVYNVHQKDEFEADINSINRPKYSEKEICDILEGALIWFISLELGETAQDIINPSSSFTIKTHPSAEERFKCLLENIKTPDEFDMNKILSIQENSKRLKAFLIDDISVNYDYYDVYGSCYLDKPNTEWRGKELIDRVDYY